MSGAGRTKKKGHDIVATLTDKDEAGTEPTMTKTKEGPNRDGTGVEQEARHDHGKKN